MIMVVKTLKCDSQWPIPIYVLAMLMNLLRHVSSLTILLRCLQDNLFSLRVKVLLHFLIALISSSFKKRTHFIISLPGISSSNYRSTRWSWAELKDRWSARYRSLSSIHGWLLCWIASIAGSLHFLTQFMSSYGPQFLLTISWIFKSKQLCFVFLTVLLKYFQSLVYLDCL